MIPDPPLPPLDPAPLAAHAGPAAPLLAPAGPLRLEQDLHLFHDAAVLGTRLTLFVRAEQREAAFAAARGVRETIDRLETVFSWRLPGSELSRLNQAASWRASDDLFAVIAAAEAWRVRSRGAFSGRLGALTAFWRSRVDLPDRQAVADLARAIDAAEVGLDAASRRIERPPEVRFDLDGLAKGYIVDAALSTALATPGVEGALVDIGGDIACAGSAHRPWRIDLPDPLSPFDNAPLCGGFELAAGAVATSGPGPRDRRLGARRLSPTLNPLTGWPAAAHRAATALAPSAADADALASALLVGGEGLDGLLQEGAGLAGRCVDRSGGRWLGGPAPPAWREAPQPPRAGQAQAQTRTRAQTQGGASDLYQSGWAPGWTADISFTAPPKDMRRSIAFRSPYVAIWVSNAERRTVRTLLLIGTIKEWQENNHVWWRLNRGNTDRLLNSRSMSTRGTGLYRIYWDGVDDEGRPLGPGRYTFHVETSREGGGHEERTLEVEFVNGQPLEAELPVDAATGGLRVEFRKL